MDGTNLFKQQLKNEDWVFLEEKDLQQQEVIPDYMNIRENENIQHIPYELRKTEQELEENLLEMKENVDIKRMINHLTENSEGASGTSQEVLFALIQLDKRLDAHKKGNRNSLIMCEEAMFRMYEALRSFKDNHTGRVWFSKLGSVRKEITLELDRFLSPYIQYATIAVGGADELPEPEKIDKERSKKVTSKHMNTIRESIMDMCKTIGKDLLSTPEVKIQKRLLLFETVKEDMMIYKALHEDEFDSKMKDFYEYYRDLQSQSRFISFLKENANENLKLQNDEVMDTVRTRAKENMERTKEPKKKEYRPEDVDYGLTKEQLAGIDEIDRWFMRNFNNGGMFGKVLKFLKTGCIDIVTDLLSRPKRERLHIYYLIQTRRRVNPTMLDVGESQNYIPDLEAFKDMMLAHKLKVVSHMTGAYVYWHKLTEAMAATDQYRDFIAAMGKMHKQAEEQEQAQKEKEENGLDGLDNLNQDQALVEQRDTMLVKFYTELGSYKQLLMKADKTKDEAEKRELTEKAKIRAKSAQSMLMGLIEADDAVKERAAEDSDVLNRQYVAELDETRNAATDVSMVGAAISKSMLIPLGLSKSVLAQAKFWTGEVGTSLAIVSAGMSAVANIYALVTSAGVLSAADITAVAFEAMDSIGKLLKATWEGTERVVDLAKQAVEGTTNAFVSSGALTSASYVLAGVTAGVGVAKMGIGGYRRGKTNSAAEALRQKRQEKLQNNPDAQEEVARDEKYEESMVKLSRLVQTKKMTSGAMMVSSAALTMAGIAAVSIPGLGLAFSIAAMTVGIVSGIVAAVQTSKAQTAFFDSYIGLDAIEAEAKKKLLEQGRPVGPPEEFRTQLRRKVAASLGFADIGSACDQIAKISADFVLSKLFEEGLSDEEKKPYLDLLKGLGVRYKPSDNAEKRRPQRLALAKAISGR